MTNESEALGYVGNGSIIGGGTGQISISQNMGLCSLAYISVLPQQRRLDRMGNPPFISNREDKQ